MGHICPPGFSTGKVSSDKMCHLGLQDSLPHGLRREAASETRLGQVVPIITQTKNKKLCNKSEMQSVNKNIPTAKYKLQLEKEG